MVGQKKNNREKLSYWACSAEDPRKEERDEKDLRKPILADENEKDVKITHSRFHLFLSLN